MPCKFTYGNDGKLMMVVCTRGSRAERTVPCASCGGVSYLLCDYPLGGKKAGQTCDRPICGACSVRFDKKTLPEKFTAVSKAEDAFDCCPAHARLLKKKLEESG